MPSHNVMTEAIHSQDLQGRVWLALQRVYGELTYEPGDRPHLLRRYLPDSVINRLLDLIGIVRSTYPFPVFALRSWATGEMPLSLEIVSRELEDVDRLFAEIQQDTLRDLCHAEDTACSAECADAAEYYGRLLEYRSSILEIIALIELIQINFLKGVKRKKKLSNLRVA